MAISDGMWSVGMSGKKTQTCSGIDNVTLVLLDGNYIRREFYFIKILMLMEIKCLYFLILISFD